MMKQTDQQIDGLPIGAKGIKQTEEYYDFFS
jgi:hypothetical protein